MGTIRQSTWGEKSTAQKGPAYSGGVDDRTEQVQKDQGGLTAINLHHPRNYVGKESPEPNVKLWAGGAARKRPREKRVFQHHRRQLKKKAKALSGENATEAD